MWKKNDPLQLYTSEGSFLWFLYSCAITLSTRCCMVLIVHC
jgi:hypothetical protein